MAWSFEGFFSNHQTHTLTEQNMRCCTPLQLVLIKNPRLGIDGKLNREKLAFTPLLLFHIQRLKALSVVLCNAVSRQVCM